MGLKQELTTAIRDAVRSCREEGAFLPGRKDVPADMPEFEIEAPRGSEQGDYATNVALALARQQREADRARPFAEAIAARLNARAAGEGAGGVLARAEPAGGGYILLTLRPDVLADAVRQAAAKPSAAGPVPPPAGRALVEFVSADPYGPLTVAHAHGAAVGSAIAALLARTGWSVSRESYVNDAAGSRQVQALARAVFSRYEQIVRGPAAAAAGAAASAAEDEYAGEYVGEIAQLIASTEGDRHAASPPDAATPLFARMALAVLRARQEATLEAFGVRFDTWFSEQSLHAGGAVERTLAELKERGHAYDEGGGLWLRSTAFGDEADRALVRAEGRPTYLAADLAYHAGKLARGYDLLVDVWGADHAGYIGRTKAGLAALGYDPDRLRVVLTAPVRVLRDGAEVKGGAATGGGAVTLEEILDEVDAATVRFFLLTNPADAPTDLDLDLARRTGESNPLYRVRDAVARAGRAARSAPADGGDLSAALRANPEAAALARAVAEFPDAVRAAADALAPDRLTRFAIDLADRVRAWQSPRAEPLPTLAAAAHATLTAALTLLDVSSDAAP